MTLKHSTATAMATIATLAASLAFMGAARAQESATAFPSKPVTIIIPVAAGGANDNETRLYVTKMTQLTGRSFLLDYKAGAGSTIGTAYVAKATPDGYTLLAVSPNFTVLPVLYKDVSFDPLKDFAPVAQMSTRTTVLLVSPDFPARSFADYLAYAKTNPDKMNFGTAGAGSGTHLAGAWLHSASNTKVTFVHYKGIGPAMQDLMTGRVDATAAVLAPAMPLIKAGKARPLAILNNERTKLLPDMHTAAEQGLPGYNWATWLGIVAPAATPAAIVNKLNEGLARVARMPDVVSSMEAEGSIPVGSTPQQFRQILATESGIWRKVVQDNAIRIAE